jgi:undecaprenyl pyrophosphate phosphatase UppP
MLIPELAYIDPGSGSLIIQGAIASIVAVVVFFRNQIARLLPRGRRQDESSATSVDDAAKGG